MLCPSCGKSVGDQVQFCEECNRRRSIQVADITQAVQTTVHLGHEPAPQRFQLSHLLWLCFRPGRFFPDVVNLLPERSLRILALFAAIVASINKIDLQMETSLLGSHPDPHSVAQQALDSWIVYWKHVCIGAGGGLLGAWIIQPWWFRARLHFCGTNGDWSMVRAVYLWPTFVSAVPAIAASVLETVSYDTPRLARAGSDPSTNAAMIIAALFTLWSVFISYAGVRKTFDAGKWSARFWFLLLPLALYTLVGILIFGH